MTGYSEKRIIVKKDNRRIFNHRLRNMRSNKRYITNAKRYESSLINTGNILMLMARSKMPVRMPWGYIKWIMKNKPSMVK